jgi:copper chaperone CopZ
VITTLRITGMTCNNCRRHVDRALREVAGVAEVDVDLMRHAATVTHDAAVDLGALVSAVESAGYTATVTEPAAAPIRDK